MYRCTSVLVYRCTRLWVYLCTGILVYRCASVPVYQCIGIPVYLCTRALVYQTFWCTRVLVSRGIDVSDQRLKDANLRSSSSRKAGDPPFEVRDNFLIPELDSGASGHSRIHNFAFQGGGLRVIIGVLVYQCTGVVPVYLCTGEPVCQSTLVLVYYHDDVPVHQCRHRCTGIPLYQCTGIPV